MDGEGRCNFHDIEGGSQFSCVIVNDTDAVRIDIEKRRVVEGSGGDRVDRRYELTLCCDADIGDADSGCAGTGNPESLEAPAGFESQTSTCKASEGEGPDNFSAWVTPHWPYWQS